MSTGLFLIGQFIFCHLLSSGVIAVELGTWSFMYILLLYVV